MIAAITVTGVLTDGFRNFGKAPEPGVTLEQPGGMVIGGSEGSGVTLMSAKIAKEDHAAYGISPMAESAQLLTATVEPVDAMDKSVDWSIAFVNPTSAWASGKTVTDYVTVTPTEDGALTATVTNLQAFGEQAVRNGHEPGKSGSVGDLYGGLCAEAYRGVAVVRGHRHGVSGRNAGDLGSGDKRAGQRRQSGVRVYNKRRLYRCGRIYGGVPRGQYLCAAIGIGVYGLYRIGRFGDGH